MIDLWMPPKPAIIRPHIEKASFLPGMFPAGAAAKVAAFPVVQATNTGSGSGTSMAVPLPASIQAGDLLIVFVAQTNTPTFTTPGGWTLLFSTANSTLRYACYYKVASGSEGATVTITSSASGFWASNSYRVSAYQGTPEAGTSATGSSTGPNPPTLSPSWGSAKTLWLAAAGIQSVSATISVAPTNYTNQVLASGTGSRAVSLRRELEASSDDPSVFTISASSHWVAQTVAIRPA